ncbi:MAG: hypothetical protein ACLFT7_02465 [Thermoplasmata archaeon]
MCGKYLKARQLAKEMEEKAKKTAEMKEEAQEQKERAEEILDDLSSLDVDWDLKGLENRLEKSEEHLEQKKFEKAFDVSQEIIEKVVEKGKAKVEEILNPLEETLESVESIDDMEEDIEEAYELVEESEIKEALEKAVDLEKRSKKLFEDRLEDEISTLEALFDRLFNRKEGNFEALEDSEELLSKAEYSLEAEDYSRAFSLLDDTKKSIRENAKKEIEEIIGEMEQRIEVLVEKGYDIDDGKEALENARSEIEKDLVGSWKSLQGRLDKINDLYAETILSEAFEKLDEEIKEAEDIGAPTKPIKEMKEEAQKLKRENNIIEVENILDDALEKIEEAKFDKVLNTIAESREDFIKAKEMGADIERPMELLKKARNSLKNDDYKEALEWAKKGREEVEELTDKLEELKNEVQKKRDEINKLEEVFEGDFSSLEEILEEAKSKLEQKSPEEAVSKLEELDEKIEETSRTKVEEISEEFEKLNETAKNLGIDVGDLSKQQEKCKKKIVSSDYFQAAKMGISGKKSVEKKVREKVEDENQRISEGVENLKELDEETATEVSELLELSEENLKEDSHIVAVEKLKEAKRVFTDRRKELAEQFIEKFSEDIKTINQTGIEFEDKDRYKEKISEAKDELSSGDNKEAFDNLIEFIPDLTRHIYEISLSLLEEAEKAGVKTDELEENLELSEEKMESGDFINAIDLSVKVLKESKNKKDERKNAYEKIKEGATRLSDLDEERIPSHELEPAKKKLKDAKNRFKARDYSHSIEKAEKALDLIGKIKVRGSFSMSKKEVERRFEIAKDLDITDERIQEFDLEIENIDNLAEEGDISEAQDLLQKKEEELNDLLMEKADEKIEDISYFLKAAGNMGFEIESHKNELKRAESLYEKGKGLESLELLEALDGELNSLKSKGDLARKELKEARSLLKKAKIIGTDVGEIDSRLDKSQEKLTNDQYNKSLEITREAKEEIIEAKEKRIENIIDDFNKKIEKLRSKNVDTALAENKVRKAKKALKKGDYSNSIRFALQSEGELERINKQKVIAKNSLSRLESMLETVKSKDILVDKAKEDFQRCEEAYESGFYPKVVENAIKASEEINEVLRTNRQIDKFLESFDLIIQELERYDFDASKSRQIKENIEDLYKDGKYVGAKEKIEEANGLMIDRKEDLKEVIKKIKEEISDKGMKEVDKTVNKLKKAGFLLDLASPRKALRNIYEAEELSGLSKLREFHKLVPQVEKSIENAKKFGASIKKAERMVRSAKDSKESGEIIEAYEKIKDANDEIEDVLEAYSPKLRLEISKTLTIDKWNTTEIRLINEGQALGKEPQLEVRGGEIRNANISKKLKGGEEKDLEVEIKPKKENSFIRASALRIFDDKVLEAEEELEVSLGSKVKKATGSEICDYCGKKMMKGDDLILCSCGKKYDSSCAEEIEECLNCGTYLDIEKEDKKKKKKRVSLDL